MEPNFETPIKIDEQQNKLASKKWSWRGQRATVEMRPWNLDSYRVDLSGSQDLSLVDNDRIYEFASIANIIHIDAKKVQGSWPREFKLRVEDFNLLEKKSRSVTKIKSVFLNIKKSVPLKLADHKDLTNVALVIQLKLQGLNLAGSLNLPLGNTIQEFSTNLRVIGHLDPVLSKQNVIKWRNAGGIVEIDSMRGVIGRLKSYGAGTLALDKKLQPLVAMSATFEGIIQTIDRLEKKGYIGSKKALLSKVMLSLFSKNSAGSNGTINLPLTIQDQKLTIGPVSLMHLPAINW